jgi:hypothetical protein
MTCASTDQTRLDRFVLPWAQSTPESSAAMPKLNYARRTPAGWNRSTFLAPTKPRVGLVNPLSRNSLDEPGSADLLVGPEARHQQTPRRTRRSASLPAPGSPCAIRESSRLPMNHTQVSCKFSSQVGQEFVLVGSCSPCVRLEVIGWATGTACASCLQQRREQRTPWTATSRLPKARPGPRTPKRLQRASDCAPYLASLAQRFEADKDDPPIFVRPKSSRVRCACPWRLCSAMPKRGAKRERDLGKSHPGWTSWRSSWRSGP